MILTPQQARRIAQVIRKHIEGFAVEVVGTEALGLTDEELGELLEGGYVSPKALSRTYDPIGDAFYIGMLRQRLIEQGLDPDAMSFDELMQHAKHDPIPLGPAERAAMDAARQRAAQYIVGLGNRIVQDVQKLVIEYDHELEAQLKTVIAGATEAAVLKRQMTRKLMSEIGDHTSDWTRDLQRIAATELQAAHEAGQAQYLRSRYGGKARVAKIPNPDACPACKNAYLDEYGRPKIFLLEELEANGSNVGRPRDQWVPTVGPMHPWCHCTLVYVPDGMGFDDEWNLVPEERLPVKLGYTLGGLYKARPHKYIQRIPTGRKDRPWRYIYPSPSTRAFGTSQREESKDPRDVEQVWVSKEFRKFKQEWKEEFERQGVKGVSTTDCYGSWSGEQGIAMEASVMVVKKGDDSDETWERFKKAGMMPIKEYEQEGVLLFRTDHKSNAQTYITHLESKESALSFASRLNREDIYTTVYEDKDGWKVMCVFMVDNKKEIEKRDDFLEIIKPVKKIDVVLIEGEAIMLEKN